MRIGLCGAQHVGSRESQQDAFGYVGSATRAFHRHAGIVAVVCDGAGGMREGASVARAASDRFLHEYLRKKPGESIPNAMARAAKAAGSAVEEVVAGLSLEPGSAATTLVGAVVHRNALHWISLGDSRLYLARNGEVLKITNDHVRPADGQLTNALGNPTSGPVDRSVRPLGLEEGDVVILCSDGLYRAFDGQLEVPTVSDRRSTACDELIRRALARSEPRQDNLTVVMLGPIGVGCGREKIPKRASPAVHAILAGLVLTLVASLWAWRWFFPSTQRDPAGVSVEDARVP